MTLLAGDGGCYLGSGPLGFQYLLQWNFNYFQKVELYEGEKRAALSRRSYQPGTGDASRPPGDGN